MALLHAIIRSSLLVFFRKWCIDTGYIPLCLSPGFLMRLISELADHHLHRERDDADTQTDSPPQYRESLGKKMQMIEDEYAALRHQENKLESLEAKLAEYRREMEMQFQVEMNAKLKHFKEVELAKIKLEEKEKSRKELWELRRDMERTYEMKSEGLINREKNAIERLQKQQEIEEKEIYMQRQSLLKEIETVRNREAELRQRMEAFEKYQLELKEEFLKRTKKLTEDEKRVKGISRVSLLKQQNELLKERLEAMSEYPALKTEKVELQAQLRLVRRRLEEALEENRQLRAGEGREPRVSVGAETCVAFWQS
uniref:Uncharacterized protein n=1 Tax=Scleropages formosus TaxID=113540 RepID=A0A8C9SIN5_SCLFO